MCIRVYPLKASNSRSLPGETGAVADTNIVGLPAEKKKRKICGDETVFVTERKRICRDASDEDRSWLKAENRGS